MPYTLAQLQFLELRLGVAIPPEFRARAAEGSSTNDGHKAAQARWQTARAAVQAQLKTLCDAIKAMKDPEADPAIILNVRAIHANIVEQLDSQKQVGELERYLQTDSIITEAEAPNGFGLSIAIRNPLLSALGDLRLQRFAWQQCHKNFQDFAFDCSSPFPAGKTPLTGSPTRWHNLMEKDSYERLGAL